MAVPPTSHPRFNDADADIIIRSSDGVDFHLHKLILAKASPVFEGMFSLPQPSPELQTVPATEDAATLEIIWDLCYPHGHSTVRVLPQLLACLEAVKKYQMTTLYMYLERDLTHLLAVDDISRLRIYAIACLHGLSKSASAAARRLMYEDNGLHFLEPSAMPPEFSDIPAAVIYAPLDYRRRCTDAVIATLNAMHWMAFGRRSRALSRAPSRNPRTQDSWAWLSCRNPHDRYDKTRVDGHTLIVKVWMKDYLAEVTKTLRSSGPNPAAVLKRSTLRQAAQSCESCPHCATIGLMDLVDYGLMVRSRMSESLNKVELHFPA